ncbi:metal-dependent hydrolase [Hydrogenophaga sp. YM1]|jgi:predicted metal-dependent hydrolase|uniref:metal-dependent hydrolase n=1 Tax=Hydrogenophaga TaxID=47420 RepID=UPI000878F509|nr:MULTISPECIES: metal-dependent hydrolase [unclassified Hydrogenophaga]MBN9371271.1 metal-dependent hydrolase [Hydrogenophaga sp.]OJV42790.1 MAG: metal-dependent hydrolase [Hydrogenophaga sp. 70-12]QRR36094.1 metal-dependent hydrolase [Hydrogenophaga sp. YM1]
MTTLTIRRLLIDLETPVARHWCGGDAFLTAWFNALSMSFPVGEQFFIDAVREGAKALPADQQARWEAEIKGFVGQEATHRRIHALFNAQIEKHGLVNAWAPRAESRMVLFEGADPRHPLGVTAAYEHFTALFAEWLLAHPQVLDGSEPRLQTLWLWHSAEEAEHKSTAFDLYQALGGDHAWRAKWMRRVTVFFLSDALRQTVSNLRRDGTLWRWSTWRSAARHLLGRQGLLRTNWPAWRAYFRPDFHPNQQHSERSATWLREHSERFVPVSAAGR